MINKTFKNIKTNKATGFVPYIVAHYPNRDTFKEALTLLAELNADVIEIGIPFTDPIAEGKVIEKAHHKVLEDNFNISDLLDDVKDFKSKFDTPLIAMGYTNSFINPDQESFCQNAKNAGFDGFLIVDMPPGTGDVQLTMTQKVNLSGAIIVSTPQEVALLDVKRGIKMFDKLGVKILGLVDNMSFFIGDDGKKYKIFGEGGVKKTAEEFQKEFLGEIPINPEVGKTGDEGKPIVETNPEHEISKIYLNFAEKIKSTYL